MEVSHKELKLLARKLSDLLSKALNEAGDQKCNSLLIEAESLVRPYSEIHLQLFQEVCRAVTAIQACDGPRKMKSQLKRNYALECISGITSIVSVKSGQ